MKKIIRKIKDWLIGKLGGITMDGARELVDECCTMHIQCLKPWKSAVREICRRSDNTYYDWCCDYCAKTCDKRNGWCERFMPVEDNENYE